MLETVLRRLNQEKGEWQRVAAESGVPYQTITKIAGRFVRNPRILTVQPLFDYFVMRPENRLLSDVLARGAVQVSTNGTTAGQR